MIVLEGLEDSFDNDRAEEMLNLSIGRITHTSELVRKSMYDFDLETPEGIEKLMALLPIMDPEILKDIMTELWPGYPTDIDARRHRLEIKGFLKDILEAAGDNKNSEEQLEEQPLSGEDAGIGEAGGVGEGESPLESATQQESSSQPAGGSAVPGDATGSQEPGVEEQAPVAPNATT